MENKTEISEAFSMRYSHGHVVFDRVKGWVKPVAVYVFTQRAQITDGKITEYSACFNIKYKN
jgi:hypothetical protein